MEQEKSLPALRVATHQLCRIHKGNGGGPDRNSDETAERQWSEGSGLFDVSQINHNQQWDD
jgi:hypothetical protein